jgi:hypothetical protein
MEVLFTFLTGRQAMAPVERLVHRARVCIKVWGQELG